MIGGEEDGEELGVDEHALFRTSFLRPRFMQIAKWRRQPGRMRTSICQFAISNWRSASVGDLLAFTGGRHLERECKVLRPFLDRVRRALSRWSRRSILTSGAHKGGNSRPFAGEMGVKGESGPPRSNRPLALLEATAEPPIEGVFSGVARPSGVEP